MANPNPESSLILKILNGNQKGVEVVLGEGTYTFGSGEDAEIQLQDVTLAPVHGSLRLRAGKIEIRADGGDLSTASGLTIARQDPDWREIAQLDVVSAGMARFALGGAAANWATVLSGIDTAPRAAPALSLTERFPKSMRALLFGGGGVVAALLLMSAINAPRGGESVPAGAESAVERLAGLRTEIAAMPFAQNVSLQERADGSLVLDGHVEDSIERRALQNAADASGLPVVLRVWLRASMRAELEEIIRSQNLDVTFELSPDGQVALGGTVLDPAAAQRLVETVRTGIFGVTGVKDGIRTGDTILAEVEGLARQSGLQDLVIFRLDGALIEVTGVVPRDKIDNWVGLIGVYSRRYADDVPLRSFVTLEEEASPQTEPVIIGETDESGQGGRVLPPAAVADGSAIDANDLFAQTPASGPASPEADAGATDAALAGLSTAIERLETLRPDLYDQISRALAEGRLPPAGALEQSLAALGGTIRPVAGSSGGEVVVPGIGTLGPLSDLPERVQTALTDPPPSATSEGEPPEQRPAAPPPVLARVPQTFDIAEEAVAVLSGDSGIPAEPAMVPESAQNAGQTDTPPATSPAEAPAQPIDMLPSFALQTPASVMLDRMVTAADIIMDARPDIPGVSPNLAALVAQQHDKLAQNETLVPGIRPISALPLAMVEPAACWPGGKLTPEMIPTALFLLDVLSVTDETDLTELELDTRELLMETALAPDRVRSCIEAEPSVYGKMLETSSAFLHETRRNSEFSSFLFRNMPVSDLDIVGANLDGERYIELADGRKLQEGAAPDVSSRPQSIGDLGVLVRTSEGLKVQLFARTLNWRVTSCETTVCN